MKSKEALRANDYTDKQLSGYIDYYERLFASRKNEQLNVLEIGVYNGGSLLMWEEYFQRSNIFGVDLNFPTIDLSTRDRVKFFRGDQTDSLLFESIRKDHAKDGFDIIIDDASHLGEFTERTFDILFEGHLKSGGLYIIEDWGASYWPTWPDGMAFGHDQELRDFGKSVYPGSYVHNHSFGIAGFIKKLVDYSATDDIRRARPEFRNGRSRIAEMSITRGIVVIQKA